MAEKIYQNQPILGLFMNLTCFMTVLLNKAIQQVTRWIFSSFLWIIYVISLLRNFVDRI